MKNSIRVALPGYNAITDTNPNHFTLYADQNNILIKEFKRGVVSVNANSTVAIVHNLGYAPFVAAWYNTPAINTDYVWVYGIRSAAEVQSGNYDINFKNLGGVNTIVFIYYIFYETFL